MGVVFEAHDRELSRTVALKLIRPAVRMDGRSRSRFVREARALAQLDHPNIVPIYDFGEHDEELFIVMRLIKGTALNEPAPSWTEQKMVDLLVAAGRGLAAAHDRGLVHRDFKPSNVLVGEDGQVYVCDFGLAIPSDDQTTATSSGARSPALTDHRAGTPLYMAPEQHEGGIASARSDQFAFCASAWQLLVGRRPFLGSSIPTLQAAKLAGEIVGSATTSRLRVLRRGMSADPDQRWPDMPSLLAELQRRPPTARLAIGAAALSVTVGVLAAAWPSPQCPTTPLAVTLGEQAGDVANGVATSMERYHQRDTEQVATVCRAWEQDAEAAAAALACVTEEHRQAAAVLKLLDEPNADPEQLKRAAPLARDLAKSKACQLDRVETRRDVTAVHVLIADARLASISGRIEVAEGFAKRAREAAGSIGEPALVALADLEWINLADDRGIGPAERSEIMWSIAAGAALSDDPLFAARGQLATLIWAACVDPTRAQALAERTSLAIDRTGPDPDVEIVWHGVRSRVALCAGDIPDAVEAAKQARSLIGPETDPWSAAMVVRELVMGLASRAPAEAVPYLDELVSRSSRAHGPQHRTTAQDRLLAAEIRAGAGDRTVASQAADALTVIEQTMRRGSPGWFDATQRVARVEAFCQDMPAAIARLQGALDQEVSPDDAQPGDRLAHATAQRTLADVLLFRHGDTDAARAAELIQDALPVLIEHYGDAAAPVLQARYGRAMALRQTKQRVAAEAAARQLVADAQALGQRSSDWFRYASLHGETLVELERPDDAITVLTDVWSDVADVAPPDAPAARVAVALTRAYVATATPKQAKHWLAVAQRYTPADAAASLDELAAQVESSTISTPASGSKL